MGRSTLASPRWAKHNPPDFDDHAPNYAKSLRDLSAQS